MLKILLIYYEPRPSGQTTHVLSLIQGLDRQNYHLTLALPPHLQQSLPRLNRANLDIIPLPIRKLIWGPGLIRSLIRLIRRHKIDIVHVHSQEAGLPMRLVAWLAGTAKIIYTPQTIDIRRANWQGVYLQIERMLAHLTDLIISVNEFDRKRLISLSISANKVVTIPNGIDLTRFDALINPSHIREDLGLLAGRPLIMQVGRLSPQKKPLAFLKGAAVVARRYPEAQFALIGEGPLQAALVQQIQALGLQEQVHLLGWRDQAFKLLAAADIVTLTSQWEGTPYALLEAMAWSRPIVTTAANGCSEVVNHGVTGYLAPVGDIDAWADAVINLLDDPAKAATMGQQGRYRVEQCFSLEQMIRQIESVYEQVANH